MWNMTWETEAACDMSPDRLLSNTSPFIETTNGLPFSFQRFTESLHGIWIKLYFYLQIVKQMFGFQVKTFALKSISYYLQQFWGFVEKHRRIETYRGISGRFWRTTVGKSSIKICLFGMNRSFCSSMGLCIRPPSNIYDLQKKDHWKWYDEIKQRWPSFIVQIKLDIHWQEHELSFYKGETRIVFWKVGLHKLDGNVVEK